MDRIYDHEYYLLHRERILKKNKAWSQRNPEKERLLAREYYYRDLEKSRKKGRATYYRIRDTGYGEEQRIRKKIKRIMQRIRDNYMGERITIYLKYRSYFDARIRKHHKYRTTKKADIAIAYITTHDTLRGVGVAFAISPERVRQIIAEFLRTCFNIYTKNKKEIEAYVPPPQEAKKDNTDRIRQVIGYLREDKGKLVYQLHLLEIRLDLLEHELRLREPKKFSSVKRDYLQPGDARRDEILEGEPFDGGGDHRTKEWKKSQIQTIQDDGNEGYLLSDVKKMLGEHYQDFFSWYQQQHYMGGMYEGEYYFLKEHVAAFLAQNQLTI